jgi:hypothetical protein
MNFVIRPIARRRLEHTNQPATAVRLALGPKDVEIQFDARVPVRTPIDGRAISWTREDGERFMVRSTLEASWLIQRFEAPDGAKTNRFELDSDRLLLKVHVTVESSKLPKPLSYTLVYRRQGS